MFANPVSENKESFPPSHVGVEHLMNRIETKTLQINILI